MLSVFRSRGLSSVVYGVIIVAIILVFVIQFNPSAGKRTASLDEQCAARVRGWCINPKDHLAAFRILIPRGPQGELETQKAKQMGLMRVALDGLVERELLVNEAGRLGISVSEEEVTDEIYNGFIHVSVPSDNSGLSSQLNVMDGKVYAGFRDPKTKRFEVKVYERAIKALVGRSPSEFREEQTRELVAGKVRDIVRTPVRVSEVEALEGYVDEKSTAIVTYLQVRQSWASKYAVSTSPADMEAWEKETENKALVDAAMKEHETKDGPKTDAQIAEVRKEVVRDLYTKIKAPDAAKSVAERILGGLKAGKPAEEALKDALAPIALRYAAQHPLPAVAPVHTATLRAAADAGARSDTTDDASSRAAADAAPPKTDTPDTDPTRPQVLTSSSFNKGSDPVPELSAAATSQVVSFAFGGAKDGDALAEAIKAKDGFVVLELKQHKTATKDEFEKDKDTYLLTLMARKQAEALSLYVKRLKDQARSEIKIDEKYLAEKMGTKDGGVPAGPGEEEEDEGP
jgi:peptidyl-prolyl cis-trans isomerase D